MENSGNIKKKKTSLYDMIRLMYSNMQEKIYLIIPEFTDYTHLIPGFTSHFHIHSVYHMVFVLDGEGCLEFTTHNIFLKKTDIVLINPMEKHIFKTGKQSLKYFACNFYLIPIDSGDNTVSRVIDQYLDRKSYTHPDTQFHDRVNVETAGLENILNLHLEQSLLIYDKNCWGALEQEIRHFRKSIEQYIQSIRFDSYYEVDFCGYMNRVFEFFTKTVVTYLSENSVENQNTHDILVQKIKNYLNGNWDKKLDLKLLAKELEYNCAYLSNHFSLKMNMTISEYHNRIRINKACEFLRYTDMNITDIAHALGYSSSQHFSRAFKEVKEITPRDYRNNIETYY